MAQEIFSALPMRTWRWLGVNEALLPKELRQPEALAEGPEQASGGSRGEITKAEDAACTKKLNTACRTIHVPAGETMEAVVVYRKEQLTEIQADVAEGGTLNLVCVQMVPADSAYAGSVTVTAGRNAKICYTAVEAGSSHTVTKLQIDLAGEGSIADVSAVYFGDKERRIDMNYVISQIGKHTDANMQVRGALQDASDKIFRGTLDFRRGSKGSTGREREEVILLDEGVRNRSVPLMMSGEDEVTGHHAVSAGRMNPDRLFYLMSRGMDEKEAQKLLVQAMFSPVLDRIPDAGLREEVAGSIEERITDGRS